MHLLEKIVSVADVIQVECSEYAKFSLLKKSRSATKTSTLKRGMSATIEEWLMAAEYIMLGI